MEKTQKFEVGDRVRIVNADIFNPELEVGDEGTITDIEDEHKSGLDIWIKFIKYGSVYRQVANHEDIELVKVRKKTK